MRIQRGEVYAVENRSELFMGWSLRVGSKMYVKVGGV